MGNDERVTMIESCLVFDLRIEVLFYFSELKKVLNFTVGVKLFLLDCLSQVMSWLMKCGSVP